MDKILINKKIDLDNKEAEITINKLRDTLNISINSMYKHHLVSRIIELNDVKLGLQFLTGDKVFIMVMKFSVESVKKGYCYHVTEFIISNNKFVNNFFGSIEYLLIGRHIDLIYNEANLESLNLINKNCPKLPCEDFKEYEYYLPITKNIVSRYKTLILKPSNELPVHEYLKAAKLFDSLIIGNKRKEDLIVYQIGNKSYYRFLQSQHKQNLGVYSGCISFTDYTFEEFVQVYSSSAINKTISNEFNYFLAKGANSSQTERRLFFLRQIEYLLYFFKNDENRVKLFEKHKIVQCKDNLSNIEIINHVLKFYGLGEYDEGVFKKFSSIQNPKIDDRLIEYIAEEVINIRNGIAHVNDPSSYSIRNIYFDLISEVSYLMFLRYIGVKFCKPSAPLLHSCTKKTEVITIPKSCKDIKNQVVDTATTCQFAKEETLAETSYKLIQIGYMRKLDDDSYIIDSQTGYKKVIDGIISKKIKVEKNGNFDLEGQLSKLESANASIVISNSNKRYRKVIEKIPDKLIVFVTRKEIVIPKSNFKIYTYSAGNTDRLCNKQ